jgi:PleD family two-component response regulator
MLFVGIGITAGDGATSIEQSLKIADLALYDAKEGERNRVCIGLHAADKHE